jgi:serine/threonine protein kinase
MLSAPPPLRGRYRLEGRVAVGGMGEVWRARDTRLGRIVAVKTLRPEFADRREFRDLLPSAPSGSAYPSSRQSLRAG